MSPVEWYTFDVHFPDGKEVRFAASSDSIITIACRKIAEAESGDISGFVTIRHPDSPELDA